MKSIFRIVITLIALATTAGLAQNLPFSKEDNKDNARFVWFVMQQEGFPYHYLPAESLRYSPHFTRIDAIKKQDGDVAAWKRFVAIYSKGLSEGNDMLVGDGSGKLSSLEKKYGKATWFRYKKGSAKSEYAQLFDTLITFISPDNLSWTKYDSAFDAEAGKGYYLWLREELIDAQGVQSRPSFSVLFSNLPPEIRTAKEFARASSARLTKYEVLSMDTIAGTPFNTYHSKEVPLPCTIFTRYLVYGRIGIQMVGKTPDVFVDKTRADFMRMLTSHKLLGKKRR